MRAVGLYPVLLALAACGQGGGIGTSAESSAGTDAGSKRSTEGAKSIEKKTDSTSSVTMPAAALIADAMRELSKDPQALRAQLARTAAKNPAGFSLLDGTTSKVERIRRVAELVVAAHSARAGWEIDPEDRSSRGKGYVLANSAIAEFASLIEPEIARYAAARTLPDPDAARQAIQNFPFSDDLVMAAADQAVATARADLRNGMVPDLASGQGIGWTAGGAKYAANQTGWTITRHGVEWFGNGAASGKHYELKVDSAISTSLAKRKSFERHEADKQETSDKASAEVK